MSDPLELPTTRDDLILRELASEADDFAYFTAVEASRKHLSQFNDKTSSKYPNLTSVTEARLNSSNSKKVRMGIWNSDSFVGSVSLTPLSDGTAEIDYWLDVRYTGRGYATLATKALAQYGIERYQQVYANVEEGNEASSKVLKRVGFRKVAKEIGKITFELGGAIAQPNNPIITNPQTEQKLERFAELPSRKEALRAKDKDNLTVFLSFAIAKKLYRCPCCSEYINIGSEHVILSRVQMSKRYTHHHIHFNCAHEKILPTLTSIQINNSCQATASAMNARGRRYRNKKRKN